MKKHTKLKKSTGITLKKSEQNLLLKQIVYCFQNSKWPDFSTDGNL